MDEALVAHASIEIDAPTPEVWAALVDPEAIRTYMFGTTVISEWTEGSRITWSGEWDGRAYEDHGEIVRMDPARLLRYTHFSPLSGKPDVPENHHTVSIELASDKGRTKVSLTQDNCGSEDERAHSQENWSGMLRSLKDFVEAH